MEEHPESPFDGEYEEHFEQRKPDPHSEFDGVHNPLAWLSEEEGLKYALDFYRLSVREQNLLGLTAAAMEVLVPLVQQMPDQRGSQGLSPRELTALVMPRIAQDEWLALFRTFRKKVDREKLIAPSLLLKSMEKVRNSAISAGNQSGLPWPMITWMSMVGSYQQGLDALIKGNFPYYAHSCTEMVSFGLIVMERAVLEWEKDGRPLEPKGFTLEERMKRAGIANAAGGGGAQAQAGDVIGGYRMPPPTGRKRLD